jgi:hypothetical protein
MYRLFNSLVSKLVGDAGLCVLVEESFVPDAPPITLPGARLYRIDDDDKMQSSRSTS